MIWFIFTREVATAQRQKIYRTLTTITTQRPSHATTEAIRRWHMSTNLFDTSWAPPPLSFGTVLTAWLSQAFAWEGSFCLLQHEEAGFRMYEITCMTPLLHMIYRQWCFTYPKIFKHSKTQWDVSWVDCQPLYALVDLVATGWNQFAACGRRLGICQEALLLRALLLLGLCGRWCIEETIRG